MTVLTVAEHRRGHLRRVSHEAQTAGRELAETTGGAVHTAVVGGAVERFAERLGREGVDTVHTVAEGEPFNNDVYTQALVQLVGDVDARVVLVPDTATGLDYAPALATRLDWPLVTDAVALDAGDGLTVTRDTGATFAVDGDRAVVTLRPGVWPAADGAGGATVAPFAADIDHGAVRTTVTDTEVVEDRDLDEADIVVAVGRGIGAEANVEPVLDLADAMGAAVAASGPVVKRGWLPADRQVGRSGATVSADVYLAVGISGATQHLAGMRDSDTVVAINTDPDAPIFDIADYGVVADLFDVVPALTAAFEQ